MLNLLSLSALLGVPPTHAATLDGDVPDINVQNFGPSVDAERTLWLDDTRVQERLVTGRLLMHYANDPLVFQDADGNETPIVSDVLQADVLAGVSLGIFRIGVGLPVYLLQAGATGSGPGLGDTRFDARLVLLDPEKVGFGLGLDGRLTLPTASVDNALGSPEAGWEATALLEKPLGKAAILANVGVRGGPAAELESLALDDFLVARLGAAYGFNDACGVALEFAGEQSLASPFGHPGSFPIEALASGYGYLGYDWVVRGGVGRALTDGVGAPDLRVVVGIGYEPRVKPPPPPPPDTDGDGILDDKDACIDDKEDVDGFKDDDGCPEADNDEDGLLDAADACPNEKEDVDNVKDSDGCPEPEVRVALALVNAADKQPLQAGRIKVTGASVAFAGGPAQTLELAPGKYEAVGSAVNFEGVTVPFEITDAGMNVVIEIAPKKETKIVVTRERIELQEAVFFDTGKATIQSRSFPLLDQVAEVMTAYPEIQLVRVEGHTDTRGNDKSNMDLSQRRADSVKAYLVGKGIAAERLVSKGFGETKPIDPAENNAAYEKNRRVEINVEKWVELPQ